MGSKRSICKPDSVDCVAKCEEKTLILGPLTDTEVPRKTTRYSETQGHLGQSDSLAERTNEQTDREVFHAQFDRHHRRTEVDDPFLDSSELAQVHHPPSHAVRDRPRLWIRLPSSTNHLASAISIVYIAGSDPVIHELRPDTVLREDRPSHRVHVLHRIAEAIRGVYLPGRPSGSSPEPDRHATRRRCISERFPVLRIVRPSGSDPNIADS